MLQESQPRHSSHSCSVCLNVFTEPKVLPCCHTFCLKCLEKITQKNGEITCPQCRRKHSIPAGGVTGFLTDFIEVYEAESAGLKSTQASLKLMCGECEQFAGSTIRYYCVDCQNYLCNDCVALHKRVKAYRGHKVIPVEEINTVTLQSSRVEHCPVHKDEALKLYCETCSKLVCRDCTLVEHRQHSYKFLEDSRKQIESEMSALKSDVEKKRAVFKHNLEEIKKVEAAALDYSEVLKADINSFFDELVRSIEARRKVVLQEAGGACQNDMKQVWGDKEFHERTIMHISSVFGLVGKAYKCTCDSEMILTALQCITQLKILQGIEWEWFGFSDVIKSTPKFTQGNISEVVIGGIDRNELLRYDVSLYSYDILLPRHEASSNMYRKRFKAMPNMAQHVFQCNPPLGSKLSISVNIKSPPFQLLVDGRSGSSVCLKQCKSPELKAVVYYGHSAKELDSTCINVAAHKKSPEWPDGNYIIEIQLICGGEHTLLLKVGSSEAKHKYTVVGRPKNGQQVKRGPDWKPSVSQGRIGFEQSNKIIGTVHFHPSTATDFGFQLSRGGHVLASRSLVTGQHDNDDDEMVDVTWNDSNTTSKYKWGKDGKYEIELA